MQWNFMKKTFVEDDVDHTIFYTSCICAKSFIISGRSVHIFLIIWENFLFIVCKHCKTISKKIL